MSAEGSAKAHGSKAKPTNRVRATLSNQCEGRSDTKGGQQLVHPEPIEETRYPQSSYMSPD
jgi:hypothetical protein